MTERSFYLLSIVGGMTLFFFSPFFTNASVHAAVVVNEFLPKTEPATQEWVELYNTGPESVSLDRWKLQTTTGFVQTFILNASWSIAPHGFLTFTGSQTGISFAIDGDSVRLFDDKNTEVDSHSFPGILGYNTTMGRDTDGGGTWGTCTTATFNTNNNCPQPSPTPTPLPVNTPTPTPTPQPTPIPIPLFTPTPTQETFGSFLPSSTERSPTPTPDRATLTLKIDKILAFQILSVAVAWGIIAAVAYLRRRK